MKTKTIIVSVAFVLVIVGLLAWSNAASAPAAAPAGAEKSALAASETFYDFGTISMKNGNVVKEFTITNPTDRSITVKSVLTSCMCTNAFVVSGAGSVKGPFGMPGHGGAAPPINELVGAGESRVIRVVYDPNAHGPAGVGRIDRSISLTDSAGGTLELGIRANVTP